MCKPGQGQLEMWDGGDGRYYPVTTQREEEHREVWREMLHGYCMKADKESKIIDCILDSFVFNMKCYIEYNNCERVLFSCGLFSQ